MTKVWPSAVKEAGVLLSDNPLAKVAEDVTDDLTDSNAILFNAFIGFSYLQVT